MVWMKVQDSTTVPIAERLIDAIMRAGTLDSREFGEDGDQARHGRRDGEDQDGEGAFVLGRCIVASSVQPTCNAT